MPGTMLYISFDLHHNPIGRLHLFSPFTEEETEAQRAELTCSKLLQWKNGTQVQLTPVGRFHI